MNKKGVIANANFFYDHIDGRIFILAEIVYRLYLYIKIVYEFTIEL